MNSSLSQYSTAIKTVMEIHPELEMPEPSGYDDFLTLFNEHAVECGFEEFTFTGPKKGLFMNQLKRYFDSKPKEDPKENEIKPIETIPKPNTQSKSARGSKNTEQKEKKPRTQRKKTEKISIEEMIKLQEEEERKRIEREQKDETSKALSDDKTKEDQKEKPSKMILKPSIPLQEQRNEIKEPEFEIPSFDNEVELFYSLIEVLTNTYDFDKGKRIMVRTKGEKPKERTNDDKENETKELNEVKLQIFDTYQKLYDSLKNFSNSHPEGVLKVSDKKIEISFPVQKKSKDSVKKEPIQFEQMELWETFKKQQSTLYKFIAKDFLSNDWNTILNSGILNSRSIIKSSLFSSVKGINKIGIMPQLNINVCEEIPTMNLPTIENGKVSSLDDYYWLILNSKTSHSHSEIFERRMGIINHPRYKEIDIVKCWNEAKEQIQTNETELGKIWKQILNSSFMFKIMFLNYNMNPLIYPCFKVFINSEGQEELFRNELKSISFIFTNHNLGPIVIDLDNSRSNVWELYDYSEFSFVRKVLEPSSNCVIDTIH